MSGAAEDRCGPVVAAPLELWTSPNIGARLWQGAAQLPLDERTAGDGRFAFTVRAGDLAPGHTLFVRYLDHFRGSRAHLAAASPALTVPGLPTR